MAAAVALVTALTVAACTRESEALAPDLALKAAAVRGDAEAVSAALADGADVNAAPAGVSALHVAARLDDAEILRLLLDAGADPDARLSGGDTAAHLAVYGGGTAALAVLIEAGADAGAMGGEAYGSSPAHSAAVVGNIGALQMLDDAGVDVNAGNPGGWRPVDQAICVGRLASVEWFLARGDIDVTLARTCSPGERRDSMLAYIESRR